MTINALYHGDNLDILRRHIPNGSVNLIYVDPPFNCKAGDAIAAGHPSWTSRCRAGLESGGFRGGP